MARLNLPNRITLGRLLASLGLFALLAVWTETSYLRGSAWALSAFLLFLGTAATDWLDGYLARKLGAVTALGRILDPFVDKVVICGSIVFLAKLEPAATFLKTWMVVVILAREFFVNAIRGFMESRGVDFSAATAGKIKMVLQCFAVGTLFFQIAFFGWDPADCPEWLAVVLHVTIWGTIVSTVHSGWLYAKTAAVSLKGEPL